MKEVIYILSKIKFFVKDIKLIIKYIKKIDISIKEFIFMQILIFLEMVFYLITPFIMGKIIDCISKENGINKLNYYILFMVIIYIFNIITYRIRSVYILKITARVEKKIKLDIFNNILNLDYLYARNINKGLLINNIEDDAMNAASILGEFLDFIRCIVTVIFILFIMIKINLLLSLLILIFIPIEFLVFLVMGRVIKNKLEILMKMKDKYLNFINDTLNGLKVINIFNIIDKRNNEFKGLTNKIYDKAVQKSKLDIDMYIIINIISFISNILILLVGGYLCLKNIITIGILVSFNSYSEKFKTESSNLSSFNSLIQNISISLERIDNICNKDNYFSNKKEKKSKDLNGEMISVKIKNLSFGYIKNNEIIKNFNYEFLKGNIYRIIGENGKGKSTVLDILSGLYPNNIEELEINYRRIVEINEYRKNIAYIDQNSYIFTDTIYQNISLYRNIDLRSIRKICKKLNIDDLIMSFPENYNTVLNKEINLSGGQKQKILIARAFVEKKEIYIFDEVTSALDRENKMIFYNIINEIKKDSIIILVSHEEILSELTNVEEIYL